MWIIISAVIANLAAHFAWALVSAYFLHPEMESAQKFILTKSGFIAVFVWAMISPQIEPAYWGWAFLSSFTATVLTEWDRFKNQ